MRTNRRREEVEKVGLIGPGFSCQLTRHLLQHWQAWVTPAANCKQLTEILRVDIVFQFSINRLMEWINAQVY